MERGWGAQEVNDSLDLARSALQVMFPKTNDLDAFMTQATSHFLIPLAVSFNFFCPERSVLPRCVETPRAPVPEASVNKNGYPSLGEIKVRLSRHQRRVQRPP
jgi:hypothetical protein